MQHLTRLKKNIKMLKVRAECSVLYDDMKNKLWEMLDAGCDTIVLGAPMPIYSHFVRV